MKNRLAYGLAAALALLASCGKDYQKTPPPQLSVQTVIDSMKPPANRFTLTSEDGGTFTSSNGVRYEFPANMFVTSSGASVSGKIEVSTTEFLNANDMMATRILPISNDKPLVSAGEFCVTARQNGSELSFAPNKLYKIRVKHRDTLSMQMFIGKVDSGKNGKINWQLNTDSTQGNVIVTNDSVILTTRSTYTNGDRYMLDTSLLTNPSGNRAKPVIDLNIYPYQSITVSLYSVDGIGDDKEIRVYAVYNWFNSVWPLNNIQFGKVTETRLPKIPMTIIAFMAHKGFTYGGSINITPETNKEYKLNMTKMYVNELNKLSK